MEEEFKKIEIEVTKWFLKNYDADFSLTGFKYITYILTKRLLGEWGQGNMEVQYLKTSEHFGTSISKTERNIRYFISTCESKHISNSKFLARIYYLIKIYLDEK